MPSPKNPKFKVGGLYTKLPAYRPSNNAPLGFQHEEGGNYLLLSKKKEKKDKFYKPQVFWAVEHIETGEVETLSESSMRRSVRSSLAEYQN